MLVQVRIGCAVMVAGLLLASEVGAQIPPAPETDGANPQLTKTQVRDILLLRALQSRGRRGGVQRGVPQFVPYGNSWFPGVPMLPPQNAQPATDDNADAKRAARVERLRQAREEVVAKRAQAAKQRAQARAAARANAAANAKAKAKD